MNAIRRISPRLACTLALVIGGLVPAGATASAADAAPGAVHAAPARPTTNVCGPVTAGALWTTAGSPYVTTCDVQVPAGVTLTIEPGTLVQLGDFHQLVVSGALRAIGSEDQPIRFAAADSTVPWGRVQLEAGSGPSEIAHAVFTGGGAGRREMLGIATDQALIRDSLFTEGYGVALEIQNGASPTVHDSRFLRFQDHNPIPPAALRIRGQSNATIEDCYFQSNNYGVFWEADASPTFVGNRFAQNGHNGVLMYGRVTRDVTLPSLGPRGWSYEILSSGITVESGASLTIEPGATLDFAGGTGLRVGGTLAIRGQATNKVLLSTNSLEPGPGKWKEIEFQAGAVDYDPVSGAGSIVDHAIIEYSGSNQTGAVLIRNSSPRISNTLIRHSGRRGITVNGDEARPQLIGNLFDANTHDPDGIGVFASGNAAPELSFNIFRNNYTGVRAEQGGKPVIESHNWFNYNLSYGVFNADREVCVEATGNDWDAPNGPSDTAALPTDACGVGRNDGAGDLVSNHVRYEPFEGQLTRPVFTSPSCGTIGQLNPTIEGLAPPDSTVEVYDNQALLGTTTASAGTSALTPFSFSPPALATGSHVLQLRAVAGAEASGISEPLELLVDPNQMIDAGGLYVSYDLDGTHYVQPYQSTSGCRTLVSGDWMIRVHPTEEVRLTVPIACPGGGPPTARLLYADASIALTARGDGRYEVAFNPLQGGPIELEVTCGGNRQVVPLGTVNVEYNGLVYDVVVGPQWGRIRQATVTLWQWDTAAFQWRIWPANEYFGQTNPQTTGLGGWFAFYPPAGTYHAVAEHPSYEPFTTADVAISTEPFVMNIALVPRPRVFLPALRRGAE